MMTDDREPEEPARSVGMDGSPAGIRTFSLNSQEAYAALCEPRARPWIPNGALVTRTRLWRPEDAADEDVRDWLRHLEAGRLGSKDRG